MNIGLPKNLALETEILSMMMNNDYCLNECMTELDSKDFYDSKNSTLFETIKILWTQEKPISESTIYSILGKNDIDKVGGISYLSEIRTSFVTSEGIKERIAILKDIEQRRELVKISDSIIKAYISEKSNDEIISIIQDGIDNISIVEEDNGDIESALNETLEKIEERYKNGGKITGISTGLIDLDKKINGLKKSELTIIAGRPGSGKTTLANNIFWNVASKGKKCLLFNLEMGKEQIYQKMLSNIGNIPARNIETGMLDDNSWNKLATATSRLNLINKNARIYDNVLGLNSIVAQCKRLDKKLNGLDLIIIDYLQLINPQKKCGNREGVIAHISRMLKLLTKTLNCSIICLSQLSRACEQRADHRPMLSDLRESGSIEQDADNVLFTYRDEYYNKETEEKNIMEIIIGKQRSGTTGTVKAAWLGEYQKVSSLDIIHN